MRNIILTNMALFVIAICCLRPAGPFVRFLTTERQHHLCMNYQLFNYSLINLASYLSLYSLLAVAFDTNHHDCDALVIVFMSSGDQGILFAKDGEFNTKMLFEYFDGDQCEALVGKPKLFFIQVR